MHSWTEHQYAREINRLKAQIQECQHKISKTRAAWFWWLDPSAHSFIKKQKIIIGASLHTIEILKTGSNANRRHS